MTWASQGADQLAKLDTIINALYSGVGIAAFPGAAAAANDVSLAEVIRYIQESQIGSLANSGGGTATLAGILGDPTNVTFATSLNKIARASAGGLTATADSLAYGIGEIERHLHSYERWYGVAAAPSGTHFADRVAKDIAPFELDAGNDTWGTWVQLLGADDTALKYDLHKMFITYAETASTVHFVQIGFGTSGAQALTDGTYTEFVYRSGAAQAREAPWEFQCRRQAIGQLAWGRVLAYDVDTSKIRFYFGLHQYEG